MTMMKTKKKVRGVTLAEVVVASAMSAMVLLFSITVFLAVTSSWARGENLMDSEGEVREAVRFCNDELRQAMWVSVDADGMGITYRIPKKEASGAFEVPAVWDGVDRRLFLENNGLWTSWSATGKRRICRNVLTTDPFVGLNNAVAARRQVVSGAMPVYPAYKIFEKNPGVVTTEITVTLVAANRGGQVGEIVRSKKREVVALRNVPELIK